MPLLDIPGEDVSLYYVIPTSTSDPPSLDRTKPTLLLTHAHMLDSTLWEPQFRDERLSGRYNLLAFDLPYHGKTVTPPKPLLDTWSMTAVVGKALDALQAGPVVIVACSHLGVALALTFNILFPTNVQGMVLGRPDLFTIEGDYLDEYVRAIDQPLLSATTVTELARHAAWVMLAINGPSLAPEYIRPFINRWIQRYICWADNFDGVFSAWRFPAEVTPQELGNIRCPISIILGDVKDPFPLEFNLDAEQVVSAIACGGTCPEVHTIRGGEAHNLAFTKPKEFNDILVGFLAGVDPKPCAPKPLDWKTAWSKFIAITGQPFRPRPANLTAMSLSNLSSDLSKQASGKFELNAQVEERAIELTGFGTYKEDRIDRLHPELTESACLALWNSIIPPP